jgi:Protein kinase domain
MDAGPSSHPTGETLQEYVLGKLGDGSAEVVRAQLKVCSECRRQVIEMSASNSAAPTIPPTEATAADEAIVDSSSSPVMSATGYVDATADASGDVNDSSLPKGTRVGYFGDYELLKVLGEGGMGIVYKARQLSLNRPVAFNMFKASRFPSADEVRRFQNESEAVARLDHPNIVPVFEVGQYEDQHYFSMKLIAGESLEKRSSDYLSDPRRVAVLMATIAGAIHHAHQRGILHRDLKPANILIDSDGQPHVTDFGLAKRVEEDSELTRSGAILGTPAYMAPEQASGRRGAVTTATDVYGLGAILYVLLTGKAPFGGDSVIDTLEQVREQAPEPPRRRNLRVPRDLEVICLKCLEKDPRRRYASADALAEDLHRFLSGEPITARAVGYFERARLWVRRHPTAAALTVTSLVALIAMTAAGFFVAYNGELKRANRVIQESRVQVEIAYASEAAARQRAEAAEEVASDERTVAVKALEEARNSLDLANRFLEAMPIAMEQLKARMSMGFPPANGPEFLEAMVENQASAEKLAYVVNETIEPLLRGARWPELVAMIRDQRGRQSLEPKVRGAKARERDAARSSLGHFELIRGRLLARKSAATSTTGHALG